MDRCNLRCTAPIVSEKVAKVLKTKCVVYEKELSYVCKNLEKEKKYSKAAIEKTKRNLIKTSLDTQPSSYGRKNEHVAINQDSLDPRDRERRSSLPTSFRSKRMKALLHCRVSSATSRHRSVGECNENENDIPKDSPLARTTPNKYTSNTTTDEDILPINSPLSSTDTDDDIFTFSPTSPASPRSPSSTRAFKLESLGSSPTNSVTSETEVPEILVSCPDEEDSSENNTQPARKISLTRSYSTGDLDNAKSAEQTQSGDAASSPVQMRRVQSICDNSGLLSRSLKEYSVTASDDKNRYGSFDEHFFQRLTNMLAENEATQKPKPRAKPYSEEPFYLRKKCLLRNWVDKKEIQTTGSQETIPNEEKEELESPLSAILPPIALPSIYRQQSTRTSTSEKTKTKKSTRHSQPKITVNVNNLTKNLDNCRYLRKSETRK